VTLDKPVPGLVAPVVAHLGAAGEAVPGDEPVVWTVLEGAVPWQASPPVEVKILVRFPKTS